MRTGRGFLSLLLLLVVPAITNLQARATTSTPDLMDMSIDQLLTVEIDSVYGASHYKQKIGDVPASITIVTAEEIRRYGYQTLADVLRSVPGLYVSYDRDYSYVGVRGFGRAGDYNSRVLLLIDGHRTNDDIYNEALIGEEFPLDIDLIARVEVIRGPNSSLYMAGAFLAVINVITKTADKQPGAAASQEASSFGTFKSRATYGHEFSNRLGMVISATWLHSAGHARLFFSDFDTPATNNGITANTDYDRAEQFFASLTYGNFHFEGLYGSREKGIPTGAFGTSFGDRAARTVDASGYLDLSYSRNFGGDWGILAHVFYDNYRYGGFYPEPPTATTPTVLNTDLSVGQWWGSEFALSKHLPDNQTLIVGAEYQSNFEQLQTNFDQQPYFILVNSHPTSRIWAVYVQDAIAINRKLSVNLGLRHDEYTTFGGTTNPRAAVIYQPWESTRFKFLYAQSFRAPTVYELDYLSDGQEANHHLRPETVKTMEIVWEQSLPRGVQFSTSYYYYPIRNLIGLATDPVTGNLVYENSEEDNLRGLEMSVKRQSAKGWEGAVSVSLQDADQVGTQQSLANSPRVLVQGSGSVPLYQHKLYASANLDYVSRRRTSAGNSVGAYFLPDFTLSSRPSTHLELSASVYNAFGQRYFDPAAIGDPEDALQQDGRTYRVKITYHF